MSEGIEKFSTAESQDDNARKIELSFDFGGSTARAVEIFGEEAVYGMFTKGAKVALQGFVRAKLSDPEMDDEAVVAAVADWKPGVRAPRAVSKTAKLEKLLSDMSPEEKAALIAKLQALNA